MADCSEAMESMPRSLSREINYAVNKSLLEKVLPTGDEISSELSARLTKRSCAKGEYLFKKGELVKEVYIVVKGIVRTAENTYVGRNQLLVPNPSIEALAETDLILA